MPQCLRPIKRVKRIPPIFIIMHSRPIVEKKVLIWQLDREEPNFYYVRQKRTCLKIVRNFPKILIFFGPNFRNHFFCWLKLRPKIHVKKVGPQKKKKNQPGGENYSKHGGQHFTLAVSRVFRGKGHPSSLSFLEGKKFHFFGPKV